MSIPNLTEIRLRNFARPLAGSMLKNGRNLNSMCATGFASADLPADTDFKRALAKPVAHFFNSLVCDWISLSGGNRECPRWRAEGQSECAVE
jgi:hypothetical protein